MKIVQTWPNGAKKLCHRSPGDIIQLAYNDGTIDKSLYMVIYPEGKGASSLNDNLTNISTGLTRRVNTSTRCIYFPEAILVPEPDFD